MDKLNWVLEHFHAANPNNPDMKSDVPKWHSTDHYFQSIGAGVSWLLEHELLEDGGEYDLAGATERFENIARDLRKYVDEAVKELN